MAALCRYAAKLTLFPHDMESRDVQDLRGVGLDDRAIIDANQVVSYFNYVNRVAPTAWGSNSRITGQRRCALPARTVSPHVSVRRNGHTCSTT